MDEKRERLAAYAHEAWSGWMKHMFSEAGAPWHTGGILIDEEHYGCWLRQMITPYADLSESEKESDRAEADKILEIMNA